MDMRFLLATEFSESCAHMLRYTLELNRHFFARLELLHVFDMPVAIGDEHGARLQDYDTCRKAFEQELWAFLEQHRGNYHFDTVVTAVSGGHYQAIADTALAGHADLIVAGHPMAEGPATLFRERLGRYLLTHAPVPVLTVPDTMTIPPKIRNILLCTDLSSIPEPRHLSFLRAFVEGLEASTQLLHVRIADEIPWEGEAGILDAWKEALGIPLTMHEHAGKESLSRVIGECVQERAIDLVVVSPHRHNWLDRLMLGSETGRLFDRIRVPLMSLPGK